MKHILIFINYANTIFRRLTVGKFMNSYEMPITDLIFLL